MPLSQVSLSLHCSHQALFNNRVTPCSLRKRHGLNERLPIGEVHSYISGRGLIINNVIV